MYSETERKNVNIEMETNLQIYDQTLEKRSKEQQTLLSEKCATPPPTFLNLHNTAHYLWYNFPHLPCNAFDFSTSI